MKKVVVASDSFKGCLSSEQVVEAVEKGVHDVFPDAEVVGLPVADGGEGSLAAVKGACNGCTEVTVTVKGPLYCDVEAKYLISQDGQTAIIEIAQACGLTLLDSHQRDPLKTTTYGFGQMIMDAISKGCRKVIVALGGTCTNDAGTGMLSALGYRITNGNGMPNACYGAELMLLADVDDSEVPQEVKETDFIVMCDVTAPFYGPYGAACVYAPQKGANRYQVKALDEGLCNFAEVIREKTGKNVQNVPGTGAAGGVAGAMYAFLGAELRSGAELILDYIDFDNVIEDADLVITGEGKIDAQTLTGKLPYIVARRTSAKRIPVLAICGISEIAELPGVYAVRQVSPMDMPLAEAKKPAIAKENIRRTVCDFLKG